MYHHHRSHTRIFALVGLFLSLTTAAIAGNAGSKTPYGRDPQPVRLYYYSYNLSHPGLSLGTEVNLKWTKMEKAGCKGARVSDRQLTLIPTLGTFQNEDYGLSIFGDAEVNYTVTYRGGLTFEVFGGPGYAQIVTTPEASSQVDTSNRLQRSTDANSGFMPMAGIGLGFDFQKMNGKDIPLELNFRGQATSTNVAAKTIAPVVQAGLIYNF